MKSRILGTVNLDDDLLEDDLEKILQFGDVKEEYSEYRFGLWKNYVLWNGTGSQKDTLFMGPQGGALRTEMGAQLPYINSLIESFFLADRLKMVRANVLCDAIILPHRDYVEFKSESDKLARIHIPLKTNDNALHSEGENVFHMRKGEVWYLDVANVHSACNFSDEPRVSLVLDFGLDGAPLESVFKEPLEGGEGVAPMIVRREPVSDEFLDSIFSLKHVVDPTNYRDLVRFLSRFHFYKDVSAVSLFDWVIKICEGANDEALVEKSKKFKNYMVEDRELKERFAL